MHNFVDMNDAQVLIATLRVVYASQFNKQFPGDGKNAVPEQMLESIVLSSLAGVRKNQFQRGLVLLTTSGKPFMPSFAEFRTLCIGQDWWNVEKAWIKACDYTKIVKHKPVEIEKDVFQYQEITTIAKFALDQVMSLILDGEMYRAKDEFTKLYTEYLAEAQLKGRVQEWYQEPKQLTSKTEEEPYIPVSNDIAQEALKNLKQKLNVKNRVVHQPQKLKATPKALNTPAVNEWPDPFDNPQEYLNACDLDGVKVPLEIRRQFGGSTV